jgi:glycosyltransferase involved in cell wall biosynthesis
MIIAVDGLEANSSRRVGIGRYAYCLLSEMHRLIHTTTEYADLHVRVYLPSPLSADMPTQSDNWQYVILKPRPLWTFTALPWVLNTQYPKANVVFSPTHYIPRFTSIAKVCSIMDLSYEFFPEYFRKRDLYKLSTWTRYSARHAAHILTISHSSENAIMDRYGVGRNRISVTYPGLSIGSGRLNMTKKALIGKYGISSNYVLAVGTLQPRKNYVRLVEAFGIFLSKNRQKFADLQLAIIGKKGWLYEEILLSPDKYGLSGRVKFLDFVEDADLPGFYTHALALAMPSLYEGFGLPVLEAMALGCPVVVSNTSSLPEIAGKAGIYVDPNSPQNIAEGLLTVVRQRNLIQGKNRIKLGQARAKEFTWERAARQTLDILVKVAAEKAN